MRNLFFRASPPVGVEAKKWLETSMLRLHQQLGWADFCARPTITPTDAFFPVLRDASLAKGAQQLGQLLCKYMQISENLVEISVSRRSAGPPPVFGPDGRHAEAGPAAHVQLRRKGRHSIVVDSHFMDQPAMLVASLCHELAHVILYENPATRADATNERLTDLTTVYAGCGVFTANAAFDFRSRSVGGGHQWSVSRLGYLSEEEYGYALALYASMRGEVRPTWSEYLDPNIRSFFEQSQRAISADESCSAARVC